MKNFILLLFFAILTLTNVSAQSRVKRGFDVNSFGDAASVYDPTLEFLGTNVKIKANKSTGKAQFTNDGGTVWKNLGSGSGSGDGGVSILENGSFEDGLTPGWSSSGGTFSQQSYTNAVEGEAKYARFIATTSGQYFETTLKVIPDFANGGCLAKINYNTTDSSNWKLQVYDSSSNLLKEENLYAKTWQDGFTSFPCPVGGTQVKARVISLGAGQIEADKGYLGKENRTFQSNQNGYLGSVKHSGAASCIYTVTTTSTFTNYPADSDCNLGTATGVLIAPATKTPSFTLPGRISGNIQVIVKGMFLHSASGQTCFGRLTDGTSTSNPAAVSYGSTSQAATSGITFTIEGIQSGFDKTFTLQGATTASGNCTIDNQTSGKTDLSFEVFQIESESKTALRPEAQDWFIDVNIGGSSNASLGTSSISSYTGIEDSGLDMIPRSGSAPAEIGCSSTNAPTGLTCSTGNESISIAWTPPQIGWYDVCFDVVHNAVLGASGSLGATFQVVETPINAQTITAEGGARLGSGSNTANSNVIQTLPNLCGRFYVSSVSKKMHRLMYEQASSGTITASVVSTDRNASYGQRDVRVRVTPVLMANNRPYLTGDQVTTPGVLKTVQFRFNLAGSTTETALCTTGTCTLNNNKGGVASSATFSSTGQYQVNLSGLANTDYICSFTVRNWTSGADPVKCWYENKTSSSFLLRCNQAGTNMNAAVDAICQGEKQ